MMIIEKMCPHCGSKDFFQFKSDIYIVKNDKEFIKKPFYGCVACKSAFVIIEDEPKEDSSIKKVGSTSTNIQKTLSKLSKGCLGVLENVK